MTYTVQFDDDETARTKLDAHDLERPPADDPRAVPPTTPLLAASPEPAAEWPEGGLAGGELGHSEAR